MPEKKISTGSNIVLATRFIEEAKRSFPDYSADYNVFHLMTIINQLEEKTKNLKTIVREHYRQQSQQ